MLSGKNALTLSVGVLGGVATYLALNPLSDYLLIWAIFIGWGCFFGSGGDTAGMTSTMIGSVFGVLCASLAAVLILKADWFGDVATAPIWVMVTVFVVVYAGSSVDALSNIPAIVYGYAATFAYILTAGLLDMDELVSSMTLVGVSLLVGAVFGLVSAKLAGSLTEAA
jgi:hypothetical protein